MTSAHVHPVYANGHGAQVRAASGLNILAGIWAVISPWIVGYGDHVGAVWNGVIVGIIIILLGAKRVSGAETTWQSWVNFILGLWLIITPWVYAFAGTDSGLQVNDVVLGIIVALLGLWSALAGRSSTPTAAA